MAAGRCGRRRKFTYLAVRGDDSCTTARPDIRLETQPLQNSERARSAAALDLVGGILGLLEQRRVERAELLTVEELDCRDRRDQQDRRQHRGPIDG